MSELQRRVLVAAVAIPIGVFVIFLGDALLAALLGMIALLGAREFFSLARAEGAEPMAGMGATLAAAVPLLVHADYLGLFRLSLATLALLVVLIFGLAVWMRPPGAKPLSSVALTLCGVLYAGCTISVAYKIRHHDYAVGDLAGAALLLFPLVLTWVGDTAAYAVGRRMGRRKLMPLVSPGKTVEGAIGAVVFSVIASILYVQLALKPAAQLELSLAGAIFFGVAISVAGQIGDLAESLLKRSAGVKDSSTLIPGHGGVLDRMDSLYFALPVSYLLMNILLMPVLRRT